MPDCPNDAELTGFLNESLPPERVAGVSAHVDGCPACQNRLDRLTHDTDGAVARYKELPAGSRTSGVESAPDAGTMIIGAGPPPTVARLTGMPTVPGFDMVAEIGRGGMGVVYKARHRRLNRLVALKMILAGGAADTRTVQRFLYEAEILARVQHPQVVQVFEVDTYQGPSGVPIPYLAMELLEGGSLGRRLRDGGKQAPRLAAELIEGVARAVHAAHLQGVIHRDLKPGNILFGNDESGTMNVEPKTAPAGGSGSSSIVHRSSLPKVTDFGLAKFTDATADLTGSGQVVGTPHYMAPEQAAGSRQLGPAADVYALGAMLFECLAGRPPFSGPDPMSVLLQVVNQTPPDVRSLRPEVPRDLAAVVARCLEKDPRRRYASAGDLADDLRRFLENRPTRARPATTRERLWLWAKRNPTVAGLTAALAAVLLFGFAAVTTLWARAEQNATDERFAKEMSRLAEDRAVAAHKAATAALGEAERQRVTANLHLARLEFDEAAARCEGGRVAEGLERFARSVELAEANGAADLARAARVNLAAWPRELPPAGRPFPHDAQPRRAAFLPDGRRMVTAGRRGEVHLWDLAAGAKLRTYKSLGRVPLLNSFISPKSSLTATTYWAVAVSPDGKTIAAGGTDAQVTLWDVDAPDRPFAFEAVPRGGDVSDLAFAPDGTLWVNDGHTGLKRWNVALRPKPAEVAKGSPAGPHPGYLQVIVASADGKRVYTGDRHGFVREWDAAACAELRNWSLGEWVQDVAVSADGARVAATGPRGVVVVIDVPGGQMTHVLSLGGAYGNGVAFAPTKPYLVASDGDGNLRVWHRETGQPVGVPLRFSGEVLRPRFRPGSDEFAVPAGTAVHVGRVPDLAGELVSAGHGLRVRGLDYSPRGDRIAVSSDDDFDLFEVGTGKLLRTANRLGGHGPLTLRYDPDPARPRVLRGLRNGIDRLAVPDGENSVPVPSFRVGKVHRIEFLPGARAFLTLDGSTLTRWDAAGPSQEKNARPAKDIPDGVEAKVIAVRPDGAEVLVAYADRVAFLHPEALEPVRTGWPAADEILDACYTPDGRRVLVGLRENSAHLLDAATGAAVVPAMPHARAVPAVAVSPDGAVLVTASRDGTARFWDAASGLPLGPPLRHHGPVTHVRYAPDGKRVATGTGTGHVMVWDVPPPPAAGTPAELRASLKR